MNRKDYGGKTPKGGKDKYMEAELKRKEKEFRRVQQELTMVSIILAIHCHHSFIISSFQISYLLLL